MKKTRFFSTGSKRLLNYILINKMWIFFGIIFTFLTGILEVPFPFIVKDVIDKIILGGDREHLHFIIFLLLILLPLKIIIPFLQKYYLGKLVRKSTFMIRQAIMEKFVYLPLDMYNKRGPGYFSSRIFNDCDTLIGNIYNTFIPMLQNFLMLVISIIAMIYIKFYLALIPIALIPLYIYINILMGNKVRKKNEVLAEDRAKFFEIFNDIIQSILSIRIIASEIFHRLNFLKKDKRYLRQTVSVFKTESILDVFNSIFSITVPSLILIIGIILITNKNMTLGDYVAFSTFVGYFLGTVRFFFSTNINYQRLKVAFKRIAEIFEWPMSHEFTNSRLKFLENPLKIQFESVYFSYGDDEAVLKNINFSITEGEKVILMGKSGAGKSTILNLILGLYLPNKGSIKISGISTSEIDIIKLRKHCSFLKQEPLLFGGTIEDNVCLFQKKRDQKQLEKSLKMANIYEFVQNLTEGVKTRIERFGNNFSVGERQRIVLSSAFYCDSDFIIFDEPTSAIDAGGIKKIIDSIKKIPRDKIVIISTHNSELIQCGDRLISIENGEVVENIVLKHKQEVKSGILLEN